MESSSKTHEFLQLQNSKLKQQIQDLKDMIRVNKESINTLSQSQPQQPFSTRKHSHNATLNLQDNEIKPSLKTQSTQLKDIIKILNSKNSQILDELFKLQRENQQLRSKLLLLEQITEGYQDQEKRNIQMIESQLKSMSRNLVFANQKLSQNEKHKFHVDNISGLAIKLKEIFSPTEQAMKFEAIEWKLREEVAIKKMDFNRVKEENRNLEKLNMNLQSELIKMKTALLMPNKPLDKVGEASIKKLALYFLEAQRKVLEGQDSDDEFEDIEIMAPELVGLFPQKVEMYKRKKQIKHVSIPKLDLGKVRELMNYNKKFVEAELKRRNNIPKTERIKLLQEQLEFTRRELTRSLLLLKDQELKNKTFQRQFRQLQNRHKLIQKSYQTMSKKMLSMNKNQLKKPDMNQTINAMMFQKNSPSLLANFKPAMLTKQTYNATNSLNDQMTIEEYRIQIYNLSEEIANLPYYSNDKTISKSGYKNQIQQGQKLVRSSSNPALIAPVSKQKTELNLFNDHNNRDYRVEINRYEENLDNIQI